MPYNTKYVYLGKVGKYTITFTKNHGKETTYSFTNPKEFINSLYGLLEAQYEGDIDEVYVITTSGDKVEMDYYNLADVIVNLQ